MDRLVKIRKTVPVAIIGGGDDAALRFNQTPKGCFVIGCNHHWVGLAEPTCVCYLDNPVYVPNHLRSALDRFTGVSIGRYQYKNHPSYAITNNWLKDKSISDTGTLAIWLAEHLSEGPYYLCGFSKHVIDGG